MKPTNKNSVRHLIQLLFTPRRVLLALLLAAFGLLAPARALAVGTWTPLANQAPNGIKSVLVLLDGTLMCHGGSDNDWWRLTPDANGSFANGTWSAMPAMHDTRSYFTSQVLRNGRVLAAGGEYGTGGGTAEIYEPTNNSWTYTPDPGAAVGITDGSFSFIDSAAATLPNGNVLAYFGGLIYDINSNTWSACSPAMGGQDESTWVKLPDGSILSIDYQPPGSTDTSTERFIPALNKWIPDAPVSQQLWQLNIGEMGGGYLLPNGKVFQLGGTNRTAIYTPSGTTNLGSWVNGPDVPNQLGSVDAPSAMMVNGKILCGFGPDNAQTGPTYFYEYDYVSNTFTPTGAPGGGTNVNAPSFTLTMTDLPDGTVLIAFGSSQLYVYTPDGTPLAAGQPTIQSVTTNLNGSFHLTGTLFTGISIGADFGDENQTASDYPIARVTNSAGLVRYCRTYNWSTNTEMTGTNIVSTEMTLPAGLLPGTYQLSVSANGNSSASVPLTTTGTPLPPVTSLIFTTIASNQMAFSWSPIGLTEAGYVVQHSTDGASFSTIASLGANVTTYTDNTVTPLTQNYYRVLGTNAVGLGNAGTRIFAAAPPVVALPAPWQAQDIGAVSGSGASGQASGTYTIIGSGSGIGTNSDQFQSAFQPIAGNLTITARVTAGQNTGANAVAGVMIRNGLGVGSLDVFMAFNGGTTNSVFQSRVNGGGNAVSTAGPGGLNVPLWVQLVRAGGTITGYTSPNGSTWTQRGTVSVGMESVVYAGLAVSSGTSTLLNTATFDNVTITGTSATTAPPLAYWRLDETSGTTAVDSRGGYNGTYTADCVLGLPGATQNTGTSVGFNGTSANISIPPLNLNNNVVTITAWVYPNGNQTPFTGIFFNRANSTASGFGFGNANDLNYTWNNSGSTYSFPSGLVLPTNHWTFVALVVQPTQAMLYMVTNGVLSGATNFTTHVVQGFDGTSYIGQDPNGGRNFKGQLDEVSFFANQALTPAQISQLAAITVNTSPTNIVATVSGGTNLNLSWPFDHTGWRLLTQTNNLAKGLSLNTNDWATVAGSAGTNLVSIPIIRTNKAAFFRLIYP